MWLTDVHILIGICFGKLHDRRCFQISLVWRSVSFFQASRQNHFVITRLRGKTQWNRLTYLLRLLADFAVRFSFPTAPSGASSDLLAFLSHLSLSRKSIRDSLGVVALRWSDVMFEVSCLMDSVRTLLFWLHPTTPWCSTLSKKKTSTVAFALLDLDQGSQG